MLDSNSVHLQNFPNTSKIYFDNNLVEEMDLVKEICSTALYLRDKENLRVRLPLNSIKIIGNNLSNLSKYKDIISDEVNVKNVNFEENLNNLADFVIEVDLKKLGTRLGEKLRDVMKDVKLNKWKELEDGKVYLGNNILERDEYTIKLKPKNKDAKNLQPLSNNKALIELDFNITEDLELEGIARDIVRLIQQDRKEANLNLSDKINLSFNVESPAIKKAIEANSDYIKTQTLALNLSIVNKIDEEFLFKDEVNKEAISIGFSVIK